MGNIRGRIVEGIVERIEYPNRCTVRADGVEEPVEVKDGIPGQTVRIAVGGTKNGTRRGRILEVVRKSPLEKREAACDIFPACGGCLYQTMEYGDQVAMKERQIKEILDRVTDGDYIFEGVAPSPAEFAFRNKMEFSFGDEYKGGPLSLGLHRKGSRHDVLTASGCRLVHEDMTKVLSCVLAFFRERGAGCYRNTAREGYLRHLLLRRGEATGEMLVCLVTTSRGRLDSEEFTKALLALRLEGRIVGILHILNDSLADAVKSDETRLIYGRDYFYEKLLGMEFKITPFSFFQPNTRAAALVYETVRRFVGDGKNRTVLDLFCGTGTIGQILSPVAGRVVGVEIVEEAVRAAGENAARNGIGNCVYVAGDVLRVLDEIDVRPDVIVLDPPRDGIHPKALPKILSLGAETIIYISCKLTSLTRDFVAIRNAGYRLTRVAGIDQFCQSCHVETVVLMSRVRD